MTTRILSTVLATAFFMTNSPRAAASADALVFVVPARQSITSVSSGELRRIYLGRLTRWKNGRRIVLTVRRPSSGAGQAFLYRVMRMSDIDYSQLWLGAVFRGEAATAPEVLATSADVHRFLSRSADALALLLSSELEPHDASIRALTVDGAAAGEPSYAFALP